MSFSTQAEKLAVFHENYGPQPLVDNPGAGTVQEGFTIVSIDPQSGYAVFQDCKDNPQARELYEFTKNKTGMTVIKNTKFRSRLLESRKTITARSVEYLLENQGFLIRIGLTKRPKKEDALPFALRFELHTLRPNFTKLAQITAWNKEGLPASVSITRQNLNEAKRKPFSPINRLDNAIDINYSERRKAYEVWGDNTPYTKYFAPFGIIEKSGEIVISAKQSLSIRVDFSEAGFRAERINKESGNKLILEAPRLCYPDIISLITDNGGEFANIPTKYPVSFYID